MPHYTRPYEPLQPNADLPENLHDRRDLHARATRMTANIDCVVVGGGVVGLTVARELAQAGREVVVLERHARLGEETSSRNSEVIHAGIYYPTGSLKARLCVEGRERLYAYCTDKGIDHRRCGKLIVAGTAAQLEALAALAATAHANGVNELERIDERELRAREPEVRGVAALWSPRTGILDSAALLVALRGDLEAAGGQVAVLANFERAVLTRAGHTITAATDGETLQLRCNVLVNAGGHESCAIARRLEGLAANAIPRLHYAKGNYFLLTRPTPFAHLIYPLPEPGGLGIHATLDLAGRTRFGPDVEWVDTVDYRVDPARAARFYAAIRGYWPALPDDALEPGYAGVRPKLAGPGAPAADFMIQGPRHHGWPGLVNLHGIESPGLTAALALGEYVRGLVL